MVKTGAGHREREAVRTLFLTGALTAYDGV